LDKPNHISISDNINTKKNLNIPISVYENSLGKPLNVVIVNNLITNFPLNIKNKEVNFLNIIKDKAKVIISNHTDNIT
jgi:hypothetical protein